MTWIVELLMRGCIKSYKPFIPGDEACEPEEEEARLIFTFFRGWSRVEKADMLDMGYRISVCLSRSTDRNPRPERLARLQQLPAAQAGRGIII